MEPPVIPDSPLRGRFLGSAQSNYSQTLATPDDSPEYPPSIARSRSAEHFNVRSFKAMNDPPATNGANGVNGTHKVESHEQPPVQLQL